MMADGPPLPLAAGTIDKRRGRARVNDAARIAGAGVADRRLRRFDPRGGVLSSAVAAWDYPSCVVRIDDGVVAIACGRPPTTATR